jgi:ketosteroid isomerase-like protein
LLVRLTVCLEKRHGEWIVVHEHHSEAAAFSRTKQDER